MSSSLTLEEQRVIDKKRKRNKKSISVYISNEHNGALTNIHRAIRCGEIGFSGIGLFHIDSHPDLMVPPNMSADVVFDPRELQYQLSNSDSGIAEFILPACYAGHINHVVWIKPSWCDQIRDGHYEFVIGNIPGDEDTRGPIRLSCPVPYFFDEGLYADASKLEHGRPMQLDVIPCFDSELLKNKIFENQWILDICLDYFSVNNPFYLEAEKLFGVDIAKLVKTLYASEQLRWRDVEIQRCNELCTEKMIHMAQVQTSLKNTFDAHIKTFLDYARQVQTDTSCRDLSREHSIVEDVSSCFLAPHTDEIRKILTFLIHSDEKAIEIFNTNGPMCDLPHERTSTQFIEESIRKLESFLSSVKIKPSIITIARSSSEELDYTPFDQMSWILKQVLEMLERLYETLDIEYDEEDPAPSQ